MLWEKMQAELDRMFKETGHQNAYFPLFVLKACLKQKKKMRKDLLKECAIVTLQIKMIQINRVN
jgi:prolyl-tRNA synthetase